MEKRTESVTQDVRQVEINTTPNAAPTMAAIAALEARPANMATQSAINDIRPAKLQAAAAVLAPLPRAMEAAAAAATALQESQAVAHVVGHEAALAATHAAAHAVMTRTKKMTPQP